jgi:hypothetical protein
MESSRGLTLGKVPEAARFVEVGPVLLLGMHFSWGWRRERRGSTTLRTFCFGLFGALVVLTACDGHPPPVGPVDANRDDVGPLDAARADGGGVDADRPDSGLDAASGPDTGIPPDTCHFDAATDFFEIDYDLRSDVRRLAATGGPTSFGIAYTTHDVSDREDLYFVELPASGGMPLTTQQLTFDDATDQSPVIVRTSAGWLIAWLSSRDGNVEVYSVVGSGSSWTATPRRQTSTATIDETTAALATDGTNNAIAWAETGTSPTTVVQRVDAMGASTGAPARLSPSGAGMIPTTFTTTGLGYLVGWLAPSGDVLVQPLDTSLATIGDPLSLTVSHNGDGTIDAVVTLTGGAAVYGVVPADPRHDVHGHLLGVDGTLFHIEQAVTIGEDTGSDAAIASLGGGYVVAYRQSGVAPMLRVLFLDGTLTEVGRADLVAMSATGGPITARVSGDGNVLLTWSDLVGSVNHMRLARLRCP